MELGAGARFDRERVAASETEAIRFQAVLESTDLGVIVADEQGTIAYANPVGGSFLEGKIGDATARNRLNQLIERLSMSKGAFYYYFDDKADLFTTVAEHAWSNNVE